MSRLIPIEPFEKRDEPSVHEEHYCMHPDCTRWGSFGYDMRFGTEWYCREHQPVDYKGKT